MTEMNDPKKFQYAPPPPPQRIKRIEQEQQRDEEILEEESQQSDEYYGVYDDNIAADFNLPPKVLTTKIALSILGGVFVAGLMLGALMFGSSQPKSMIQGLSGVVENKDVLAGRKRCGIAENGQGCVLYLMNNSRRERKGSSFYDEAARLTGVPQYSISMANVQYAEVLIRPGYIAKINIPPMK
jgi:hypothetical protein